MKHQGISRELQRVVSFASTIVILFFFFIVASVQYRVTDRHSGEGTDTPSAQDNKPDYALVINASLFGPPHLQIPRLCVCVKIQICGVRVTWENNSVFVFRGENTWVI